MRRTLATMTFLLVAISAQAADPVFIDQLIETPLATLQAQFPSMKKKGCYRIGESRYLLISIEAKKEHKPWRIALTSVEPCKRAEDITGLDVQDRSGVQLGDPSLSVVQRLGRPDASAPPEQALRKLGDTEYFFICRLAEGCARHKSVFLRGGTVTALVEWYSE